MRRRNVCLLCGRSDLRRIGRNQDFRDSHMMLCRNCGLIGTYPVPEEDILKQYYESTYSQNRLRNLNAESIASFDKRANAQIAFITQSGLFGSNNPDVCFAARSILEIGCGPASLLKILEGYGAMVTGIDVDANILEMAKNRLSPNALLYSGSFQLGMFDGGIFDLILVSHFLEHVQSPLTFMAELLRLTSLGGAIFIEVPNSNLGRVCRMVRRGYTGTGHLLFFNRSSLSSLINATGGTLRYLETFGPDVTQVHVPFGSGGSTIQKNLRRADKCIANLLRTFGVRKDEIVLDKTSTEIRSPDDIEGIFIRALAVPQSNAIKSPEASM